MFCNFISPVLEKTPESPLDSKEIKPVNLKGNQLWILIERTEAEASVFWSSDANSKLIGKVPDAGKDWGQTEKRVSEHKMTGWHYPCNGHELGQTERSWGTGKPGMPQSMKSQSRRWLGDWTTAIAKSNLWIIHTTKLKQTLCWQIKIKGFVSKDYYLENKMQSPFHASQFSFSELIPAPEKIAK